MPKRALLALVLLIVACRAQIRDLEGVRNPNAHAWPDEPVAVLIEHDPWAMVIGADTPRAEVFRDGTVLRLDVGDRSRPPQLLVSQLTATERDHLLNVIGPSWTFWRMRDEYNLAPNVTDMITTELIVSDGNRLKRIQVYGYAPEEWHPPAYTILPRNKTADSLPSEVDRICKVLATLKPHHEVPWEPRYIEVMMWPYDHSREQPLPGPRE